MLTAALHCCIMWWTSKASAVRLYLVGSPALNRHTPCTESSAAQEAVRGLLRASPNHPTGLPDPSQQCPWRQSGRPCFRLGGPAQDAAGARTAQLGLGQRIVPCEGGAFPGSRGQESSCLSEFSSPLTRAQHSQAG